jgi:hypothetical protein
MSEIVHSTIKAHCPNCGGERNAYVRGHHVVNSSDEEDGTSSQDLGRILECCGCGRVFFRRDFWFSEWETIGQHPITGDPRLEGGTETTYWPAPVARKPPKWMDNLEKDRTLEKLLSEMYSALNSDLRVLAAIGARTVFDCSSEGLGIDPGLTFEKKLAELQEQGKISVDERDTLRVLVDAGSAAAHRGWRPEIEELNTMMDVVETFLHRTFILDGGIKKLKAAVPARSKSKS